MVKAVKIAARNNVEDDGPSILHNAEVTLADYSGYRYMRENPVYVNKKGATGTKIIRVACSNSETRIEMECEAGVANDGVYIKGSTYIKGNKGGKQSLVSVQNVTMAPARTNIPWPYQKLRFALIFPALPDEAKEFDLIEPLIDKRSEVQYPKSFTIVNDDEATAVREVMNHEGGSETVHDLQGRRVNGQPQSGIYIKGGKKIIIK